jgi:apolipoprotein N-acyltransferase
VQALFPGEAPEPARRQEEDALPRLRLRPVATPSIPLPAALAVSVGAGLALSLAFPPAEVWPLAFLAVAPLLWLLRGVRPARGFVLGLTFGLAFFGATLYWIFLFGALAWIALTLASALAVAVVGMLAPAVLHPGHPLRGAIGLASVWTVVDWVRGLWPLGGFTWGGLGVSQVDDRALLPLATVAGVWGVTFVVVVVNALVVEAVAGGGGGRRRGARLALAIVAILAPIAIPFSQPNGPTLDVASIQVDVREADAATGTEKDIQVARLNIELDRTLTSAGSPDLVLWGEGALDPGALSDVATTDAVRQVVEEVGVPTVIGAVIDDADGQHTSVVVLDGQGHTGGRYDKVHLVPFGEYVPFRDELGWVDAIRQIPVDRVAGTRIAPLVAPGLPPFGTPICFENSFPAIPRAMVRAGATFLVVPVNNASYGFTAASDQHLQMSRMRAVETGRWVVDAAISGVTAYVDPQGRVLARTDLFETTILRDRIRASTVETPYVRLGDWVPLLSLVVVVGIVALPRRRSQVRPSPGPLPASPRTLVILPTYEERATIERVIRGLLEAPDAVQVFVVDDSSPDGTADVVRVVMAGEPRVRLHERPAKSGLASAYLEGFRRALEEGFDLAVEMDSDLSHDPRELPRLLAAASAHDLTIGSRYVPGGSVSNWSKARIALSRGGNLYARAMLGLQVHDATSGYRVYRRELLEEIIRRPFASDGYGFQIELVLRSWRLGFDVGEAPITFREREHGRSKISRRIVAEALWLVARWGFSLRFRGGAGVD